MGTSRLEVLWSPYHTNKFLTWSNDIYLYEVKSNKEQTRPSDIPISEKGSMARLLYTNTNHKYVKCLDVYPRSETDLLLAVGQANGKVSLATFGPTIYDSIGLAGLEFGSKYARQCNSVKWNPVETNLIATGFEKHRSDYAINIWDVMRSPAQSKMPNIFAVPVMGTESVSSNASVTSNGGSIYIKPIVEMGMADCVHSLAWFNKSCHTLIAGANNKNLKIVDIRDTTLSSLTSQTTKAVYGVEMAPDNEHLCVSYGDNVICLWDVRTFDKPLLCMTQQRVVTKVLWCPTRHNLLGSIHRESSAIHLHDIQKSIDGNEPSILARSVQPGDNTPISSFSWHPKDENRLLSVSHLGVLTDYVVFERMTLNWSPSSHIIWTYGRKHLKLISERDSGYSHVRDLASKMKRRAVAEYGIKQHLWQNEEICENNKMRSVWQWLSLSKLLAKERVTATNPLVYHSGVKYVLGLDSNSSTLSPKSEMVFSQWSDFPLSVVTYKSDRRDQALQLCSWKLDKDGGNTLVDKLEMEENYCRAVAVAIFNLRLKLAVTILNKAAVRLGNNNWAIIATALSGYTTDKKSLWRDSCIATKTQLTDPYLKASFSFLVDQSDTYETVLNETGVIIDDRIAFACTFLCDADLVAYIGKLSEKVLNEGDITGVVLLGTGKELIPLLERYLENTGDIQNVCAVAISAFHPTLLHEDLTCKAWIESYRSLLDGWRLWNQRAKFDICLNVGQVPSQQVYLSCNFCGKSVAAFMDEKGPLKPKIAVNPQSNDAANYQGQRVFHDEVTSCPNCHKPLPRCAVCLASMGTQSSYAGPVPRDETTKVDKYGKSGDKVELKGKVEKAAEGKSSTADIASPAAYNIKLSDFSSWFSWCQTCRHGGHVAHLTIWFEEHTECPVAGCLCHCLLLDDV